MCYIVLSKNKTKEATTLMRTDVHSQPQRLEEILTNDPLVTKAFLKGLVSGYNLAQAQGKEQEKK